MNDVSPTVEPATSLETPQAEPLFQEQETPQSQETEVNPFETYFSTLSDEEKEVFSKNGVKDTKTLHSSYKGLMELKGRKGLVKPSDNAPEEEKTAYKQALYQELGVPEKAEYEYHTPEGVNPEMIKEDFVSKLAEVAHEKGISTDGFQSLINTIYPAYQEEVQAYQNEITTLRGKLGEGTINPAPDATANIQNKDDIADKLIQESIQAFNQNDMSTYAKKQKALNQLRGY